MSTHELVLFVLVVALLAVAVCVWRVAGVLSHLDERVSRAHESVRAAGGCNRDRGRAQ